jgi:hypothetical protein
MKLSSLAARSLSRRWSTIEPAGDEPPRVKRLDEGKEREREREREGAGRGEMKFN